MGSSGFIEIAVNKGNAARVWVLGAGRSRFCSCLKAKDKEQKKEFFDSDLPRRAGQALPLRMLGGIQRERSSVTEIRAGARIEPIAQRVAQKIKCEDGEHDR